jgi:tetratricopeptide (TPR) repeat protein
MSDHDYPKSLHDRFRELLAAGDAACNRGELAEALQLYREALKLDEQIAAAAGYAPEPLYELGALLNRLCSKAQMRRGSAEAQRCFELRLEVAERIRTPLPNAAPELDAICESLRGLAAMTLKRSNLVDVHERFDELLRLAEQTREEGNDDRQALLLIREELVDLSGQLFRSGHQ